MLLSEAIEIYLTNLEMRTESKETKRGYKNMLNNDFKPYIESKYNGLVYIDEISMADIEDYLRYRKDTMKDANVSVNRNLYILRSLYKYLLSRDIVEKNLAENIEPLKVKKKERDTLTLDEIEELIDAIDHDLIQLAVKTLSLSGLRISELCQLKLNNVDLEKKMIQVVNGKGGKDRKIPLAESLLPELKKYVNEERPNVDTDNFFALETSGSLSPQYVNRVLKETTSKLGWEKEITAHNLRHSLATNLIRNGANIKDVSKILGHSDLRTTSIYLHSNDKELSDTIGLLG